MAATIKDIAQAAGVSIATVSKILNNKDENISEATRKQVLNAIEKYDYVPNSVARSLVTKKTKTIGLIIPDIRNPFFPEIARGAEDRANEEGYNIIFCNTDDDEIKEKQYLSMLKEKMVDGIVLGCSSNRKFGNSSMEDESIPIVSVDRDINDEGVSGKVVVDNVSGAFKGVKHLLDNGYRKILLISGPLSTKTARDRLEGYEKALEKVNIEYREDLILEGEYRFEWGYKAGTKAIEEKLDFDGIFCGNDMIAFGVMKAFKERGIQIPQDVGIVGFDDIYMASLVDPELTTVSQPNYEIGYKAVEMLVNIIEGRKLDRNNIVLDTKLIERNSTRKLI